MGRHDSFSAGGGSVTIVISSSAGVVGGDLSGSLPNPDVVAFHSGSQQITFDHIVSGEFLKRDGNTIVSDPGGGGGVTDHGALTGLGDAADHPWAATTSSLNAVSSSVATDINTLEGDISTNTGAITTLSGVVATDINTNQADIATNTGAITALSGVAAQTDLNLAAATTTLSGVVATDINTNQADIATNAGATTTLSGVVATDINTLEGDISTNASNFTGLSGSVAAHENDSTIHFTVASLTNLGTVGVQDDGIVVVPEAAFINFDGSGISAIVAHNSGVLVTVTSGSGGGGGVTDHGALTGLGDAADHPWAATTSSLNALSSSVAADINTNQADISTNTGAITTLSGVVATDINTLEADISTNTGAITTLSGVVATDINTNQADIATNASNHTALSGAVAAHELDGDIHFTEASISHANILGVGTNAHTDIDSHIDSADIHLSASQIDHGLLLGLGDAADHPWAATTSSLNTVSASIATDINTNQADISTNTGAITTLSGVTAQSDLDLGSDISTNAANHTALSGAVAAHELDATIHFTVASISHTAIADIGSKAHSVIDSHIDDTDIHFSEAVVTTLSGVVATDINTLEADISTNASNHTALSGAVAAHELDSTIHFTKASISHTAIADIGTNSHDTIDTHIADLDIHWSSGALDSYTLTSSFLVVSSALDTAIADSIIENGFDNKDDSTISFVDGTRTFTISPTGSQYDYWSNGVQYTPTGPQSTILEDDEGMQYVYFDGAALTSSLDFSDAIITDYAYVAAVFWNADDAESIFFAEERHCRTMDSSTHLYLHYTFGTAYDSGLELQNMVVDGNGSLDTHAQCTVEDGVIRDEDIVITITNGSPQTLGPIAEVPMYWRSGSSGNMRKIPATTFLVTTTGTGRAAWNEYTGATWQLTEATNNDYVLTHFFATNDLVDPVIGIVGQSEYATIALARAGAIDELLGLELGAEGAFASEFKSIASVIWQTSTGYANTVKSRIVSTDDGSDYIDWRQSLAGGSTGGGGSADHGALSGLGDAADHPWAATTSSLDAVSSSIATDILTNTTSITTLSGVVATDINTNQADIATNSSAITTLSGATAADINFLRLPPSVLDSTGNRTLSDADNGYMIYMSGSSANILQVPNTLADGFHCMAFQATPSNIQVVATNTLFFPSTTFTSRSLEEGATIALHSGSLGVVLGGILETI